MSPDCHEKPRTTSVQLSLTLLLILLMPSIVSSFVVSSACLNVRFSTEEARRCVLFNENGQGNNDNNNKRIQEDDESSIDEFLDEPFFDPDAVSEDDPAPIRWFADLVKNDYATAETLYAGALFVIMVIISQELLRMQIYGDGYVPFQAGVKPGQLF